MNPKSEYSIGALTVGFTLAAYFGAYFLTADYVDVGDNQPIYLLQYRIGSHSLQALSAVFEPARRVDENLLRRRHSTQLGFRVGGEPVR
jgi:hypothetical protein